MNHSPRRCVFHAFPRIRGSSPMRGVRERAAAMIVQATIGLYPGESSDRVIPWPTRRVPRIFVRGPARRGWQALVEAEQAYRRSFARKHAYTERWSKL